jgi:hypothetical protein
MRSVLANLELISTELKLEPGGEVGHAKRLFPFIDFAKAFVKNQNGEGSLSDTTKENLLTLVRAMATKAGHYCQYVLAAGYAEDYVASMAAEFLAAGTKKVIR